MKKVVVLFTKPFGAYAKGDRAGFDADAAQHLKDLGVAKPEAEPYQQEQQGADAARAGAGGAATEQKLPDQEPEQAVQADAEQALQASDQQLKPAGKAPKGSKA